MPRKGEPLPKADPKPVPPIGVKVSMGTPLVWHPGAGR